MGNECYLCDWFRNCFAFDFKTVKVVESVPGYPHTNIKFIFLPPYSTTSFQLTDQGIFNLIHLSEGLLCLRIDQLMERSPIFKR